MFGDDPLLAQDSPPDLIGDVATVVVVHPAEASISVTHRYVFTNTAADHDAFTFRALNGNVSK